LSKNSDDMEFGQFTALLKLMNYSRLTLDWDKCFFLWKCFIWGHMSHSYLQLYIAITKTL